MNQQNILEEYEEYQEYIDRKNEAEQAAMETDQTLEG